MTRTPATRCDPQPPDPEYANYFEVGHNRLELVLAFGLHYEDAETWHCHTRIVMCPLYARELLRVLSDALERRPGDVE